MSNLTPTKENIMEAIVNEFGTEQVGWTRDEYVVVLPEMLAEFFHTYIINNTNQTFHVPTPVEVHAALCNAWDAKPGQDDFADPDTIGLQTEAIINLMAINNHHTVFYDLYEKMTEFFLNADLSNLMTNDYEGAFEIRRKLNTETTVARIHK